MKIKFSKKILSVVLAAVMVITSIPIIAISTSAATRAGEQEVTGVVTIDPVIYLHGAYNGDTSSPYAYMMNGDVIADGTADGEKSTTFESTKAVSTVSVVETGATLAANGNKLSGSLGGDYGSVTTSTTGKYATLKFTFTDGTVEYHKLAVKANPVAQHVLGVAQRYGRMSNDKKRFVAVGLLANGSYGQNGGSYSRTQLTDAEENSGYINHPSMYHMWNASYQAGDNYISGLDDNRLSVDKITGFAARAQGNNGGSMFGGRDGNIDLTVNAATATYYYDVSSTDNEGFYNNDTIQMLVSALNHAGWEADCKPINLMSNMVSDTKAFGVSGTTAINGSITGTDCFSNNADAYGYFNILLKDKTVGTKTATFTVKYQHTTSTPYAGLTLTMPFQVIVSDKTEIRNAYNECISSDLVSKCYTADSWEAYKNALLTVESYLNDYQTYDTSMQTAYLTALNSAKTNLVPIEDNTDAIHSFTINNVVAPTCTTDGYTSHTCEYCGYTFTDTVVPATNHKFVYTPIDGEYNHTVSCEIGDLVEYTEACVDSNNDGLCDKCTQSLLADWSYYEEQLEALRAALNGTDDQRLTTEKLTEIQTYFKSGSVLTYYNLYTSGQQDTVTASQQATLNHEADILKGLMPVADDYIQIQEAVTATLNEDIDQYDDTMLTALQDALSVPVQIGINTYDGVSYTNQDELDQALRDALNSAMVYDVYLNGQLILEDVDYGSYVILTGDGRVLDNEENVEGNNYSWSGFFAAPSYGVSTDGEYEYNTSMERYLTTSKYYSFVVKGDSYLTAVDSSDDESLSRVMVKNNVTGFVSNVFYVPTGEPMGAELEQSQRNIACYTFDNFYSASTGGEVVNADTIVNGDMVVYARYSPNRTVEYDIAAYESYVGFYNGQDVIIGDGVNPVKYNYNDKITVTSSNADFYAWAKIVDVNDYTNYKAYIVSYDKEYTFNVCEDAYIFAITKAEAESGTLVATDNCKLINCNDADYNPANDTFQIFAKSELVPIYSSSDELEKVSLVGSFALPEGYKVLEKGFLIDYYNRGITAENFTVLNGDLSRNKVIHITEGGNQYVLNVIGGGKYPMDYRAYAVVEDGEGNRTEIYSNIIHTEAVV